MIDTYSDLNEAVISSLGILQGKKNILYVHHDEYDEKYDYDGYIAWQFFGEDTENLEDLKIVAIKNILDLDSSILPILKKISPGYTAHRKNINAEWNIYKNPEEQEED